jgi:hypothetical protein
MNRTRLQHGQSQSIKLGTDQAVDLLNFWRRSGTRLQFAIAIPEITAVLTVVIEAVEFPRITLNLANAERPQGIEVNFSGSELELSGIGTSLRASWLSREGREIILAEPT